ncbi:uncharacterized protein STEHIDRAFT_136731 [Stereum hirsutum FP-91666 SS1]|uniref:uncharacterized protein n=1 Tax=Stereum hirsutum (strain FP-91666) TaxID=721885 RepID=UPI0004409ED0|nr:uncharacterized protein STEHIDRAFT_136731 [Stereum hirsutum FP-91666 SS1]EIM90715.1 hypothetical protein STEHIDRAFT_136731 [Stereum hirsutum FP-91666 SS1]
MTTARPSMDSLPNETLLYIISMCEDFRPSASHPNPVLPRLSLVCKSLHAVATHELYKSVYLSPSSKHGLLRLYFKATTFLHAVQNNPYLASIVRELHFTSPWCNTVETEQLSEVIRRCGGVEVLDLSGWVSASDSRGNSLEGLVEAMRGKAELKSVRLSHKTGYSLAGMEDFLNMPQLWPNIEAVLIEDEAIGKAEIWEGITCAGEDEDHEIFTDSVFTEEVLGESDHFAGLKPPPALSIRTNACPRLRQLSFRCQYLQDIHIIALSIIAPNLESLFVLAGQPDEAFTASSLRSALGRWSYSLTELRVVYKVDDDLDGQSNVGSTWMWSEESMSEVLPPEMGALRLARTTSIHIPPIDFITGYRALEKLTYGLWYDEAAVLLQVLRSEGSLPRLRQLNVIAGNYGKHMPEFDVSVGVLEDVCLSRGVEYRFNEDDEEGTRVGHYLYGVRMHNHDWD